MSKYRSLATVSAIALTAGWMTSAQAATDPNLLIDLDSPSIQTDGAAAAAVIASVSVNGSLGAAASVQGPNVFSGLNDIGGGANVSALVDGNTIFALTIGNDVANEADPGAATGVSPDNGLIVGTVSANLGGSLNATVTGALVLNDVEDAGPNNTLSTSSNTISATVEGNTLESFIGRDIPGNVVVDGDVPDGYTSAEQGQITIDDTGFGNSDLNAGGREIEASGSYTVGSVQFNSGLTDATALVENSRIALQAVADGVETTAIVSSDLDLVSNTIEAAIDGNVSVNAIDLTAGDPTGFSGSASVANLQANAFNDTSMIAVVDGASIEAGGGFFVGTPIADLDGSSLDVNNNRLLAAASANTSDNEINIAAGISVTGPNATAAAQDNSLDLSVASAMNLEGDLIVANAQASDTSILAAVGESVISVRTESLTNAPVNLNSNEIAANSVMNAASNDITVGGATTLEAVVGVSNLQYATADSSASILAAVVAGIAGDEDVTASAVNVNDNRITGFATGNLASSVSSVTATNIDVDALAGDAFIDGRENDTAEVIADFSVLSAQVVEGGTVESDVAAALAVFIAEGAEVDSSQISVSRNLVSSQAIGNRVTENGLDIDTGATFSGTAGVLVSQNLIGGAQVDASVGDAGFSGEFIFLQVAEDAGTLVAADAIDVDANTISATVVGNLVDAATNFLNIDGTTITDGGQAGTNGPSGFVGRAVGGFVDGTPNVATDSGFGIVTDQLVADAGTFNVTLDGIIDDNNAIRVDVGSDLAAVSAASISVDDNRVALSGTLNQAATEANIGSDGTVSIDGSTALVNAQSVLDTDADDSSANLNVFLDFGGDIVLEVEGNDTDPVTGSAISASNNDISAAGRVNVASNSVTVTAVNQALTAIDPTFDPVTAQASSEAPNDISAFGETTLVNDQYAAGGDIDADNPFVLVSNGEAGALGDPGAGVELAIITAGGDIAAASVDVDGNRITTLASVNTGSNEINLNVQNFDLSDADDAVGVARNGPVATLVSMQRTVDLGEGGTVRSLVADADVLAELVSTGGSLTGAAVSVDGNVLNSQAAGNTVSNTLDVAGTTFVNPVASDPTAQVGDVALFGLRDFVLSDTTFAVGSVQRNAFDIEAILEDSDFQVLVDTSAGIDSTALSASGNRLTAEATGNNAVNAASTDFTSNHAGMMVVNYQENEFATIEASVNPGNPAVIDAATQVGIDAVRDSLPDISNSSLTVDNNAILALANGSVGANRIDVDGGSLLGSGLEAATDPSIVVDGTVGATALITANADIGLVSLQTGNALNTVSALVDEAQISVNAVDLLDGVSVAVTGNQIGAQAVFQTATNVIDANLSANVGGADDEPTIALVNSQIGSATVTATVIDANIGSLEADDPAELIDTSDAGAASLTVDNNALVAFAEGARSTNALSVVAGANIEGDPDRQTGTAPVLTVAGPASTDIDSIYTADFALLNVQGAIAPVTAIIQPDGTDDNVDTTGIGILTQAGAVNDSYTVDNNLINARALGVVSNNVLVMDAGATSSATAQLGNGQASLGSVTATIDGSLDQPIAFAAELDGDVTNSSLSVDNNQMASLAQANTASNIILASADAGFQESSGLSFETDNGAGDRVVTNADIVVFNQQDASTLDFGGGPIFGDEVSSIVTDAAAGIDLGTGGALSNATLSVDGNAFTASSIANDAVNAVALNSDLSARPSVAVISIQTTENRTISATTSNVTIGITGVTGAANSSSSVSGNRVGATAIGNRSFSSIGQ